MAKNPPDDELREIFRKSKTIAVIGMSKNPEKDAYSVPAYLKEKGYTIIPVNPTAQEILGEKAYPRLSDVPGKVDVVDVFRPSADISNYVADVLEKRPKVFWLQLGITNEEAESRVRTAGIKVVHDMCMMREHKRLGLG